MNLPGFLPMLVAVGAGLICAALILAEGRSLRLGLLAIQYLAVALLCALALPLPVAVVKWVAGLMSCGILTLTVTRLSTERQESVPDVIPSGRWFRTLAVLLVTLAAVGLAGTNWLGVPQIEPAANLGATLLMGLGLLQLGLSQARLRVGIGLMSLISGFEVAYCFVEPSLAVLALLGSIHIGLALVTSYLMAAAPPREALDPSPR